MTASLHTTLGKDETHALLDFQHMHIVLWVKPSAVNLHESVTNSYTLQESLAGLPHLHDLPGFAVEFQPKLARAGDRIELNSFGLVRHFTKIIVQFALHVSQLCILNS